MYCKILRIYKTHINTIIAFFSLLNNDNEILDKKYNLVTALGG